MTTLNVTEALKTELANREYGTHIAGARKDDYTWMTESQRKVSVKKDKFWKTLKTTDMLKEGYPQHIIYMISDFRKCIMTTPLNFEPDTCLTYSRNVTELRDRAMQVKTYKEMQDLISYVKERYFIKSGYFYSRKSDCFLSKIPSLQTESYYMRKAKKQGIGLTKDEKLRDSVSSQFEIFPIDDSITVNEAEKRIEIRKAWSISCFYPKCLPELTKGEYILLNHNGYCKTFKESDDARIAKEQLVEAIINPLLDSGAGSKKQFVIKDTTNAKRNGPDYIGQLCKEDGADPHASGKYMDSILGFDKAQYGNYVSVTGMIDSLDSTFCAALDLANLLNIPPKSISFNGQLGLAFGARGRSAAAAHYEPAMKVINITYDLKAKTTRSGCFAHEWAHALDNYIGSKLPYGTDLSHATEAFNAPVPLKELVSTMREVVTYETPDKDEQLKAIKKAERYITSYTDGYRAVIEKKHPEQLSLFDEYVQKIVCAESEQGEKTVTELSNFLKSVTGHVIAKDIRRQLITNVFHVASVRKQNSSTEPVRVKRKTEFLKGSEEFDKMFSKSGNGYWSSTVEMFARAFDCYIEDKLKLAGLRSDYLSSHASGYKFNGACAIPVGEERTKINKCFDELFDYLRKDLLK